MNWTEQLSKMSVEQLHKIQAAVTAELKSREASADINSIKSTKKAIEYLLMVASGAHTYVEAKVEGCHRILLQTWPKSAKKIKRAIDLAGDLSNEFDELSSISEDDPQYEDLSTSYEKGFDRLDALLHSLETS